MEAYASVTRSREQKKSCNGEIAACKDCSGLVCCGVVSEGGIIEPPFLTRGDIEDIVRFTGLTIDQFANERVNPVTGNKVHFMQTKENQGCVFFDSANGKCQIFSFRPVDCRLFPLDLELRDDQYFWARYKYVCKLTVRDISSLLGFADEALHLLGDYLLDYATYPVPTMQRIGYDLIKKVKTK